jgi:MFS family permease
MIEGLRFVQKDVPTRRMVLLMAAMSCFCSPFLMIVMPLYARNTLSLGAEQMGLLMAISGVGSFAGSLGLLSIPRDRRTLALRLGGASATVALLGMSAATTLVTACISIIFLTLGLSTAFGLSNIVIQERAPDAIRGRISAVAGLAFFGILPFSGLLISAVVDFLGMRTSLFCAATGYALAVLILLGRSQALTSPGVHDAAEQGE